MKFKLNATVAAFAIALGATTAFSANAENLEAEKIVKAAEAKIHSVSPELKGMKVELDATADAYVKDHGTRYIPVRVEGTRFMLAEDGAGLITPSNLIVISDDQFVRSSELLIEYDFSGENLTKWPTYELPEGVEKQGDLYVFTDPTCGYCHKVEDERDTYLENGIQIHYIPWPRSGMRNRSAEPYDKWAKAMCSLNPSESYHRISLERDFVPVPDPQKDMADCEKIINDGWVLGYDNGVSGTPVLVAKPSDGGQISVTPGYKPVKEVGMSMGILIKDNPIGALSTSQ